MKFILFAILACLLLLMVATVLVWNHFGIWGLVGLFVLVVIGLQGLKILVGRLLRSIFLSPFKAKGKVLEGAQILVHSVRPTEPPEREDDEDDFDEDDYDELDVEQLRQEIAEEREELARLDAERHWFYVDLTLTPQDIGSTSFTHWDHYELMLVDPDSEPGDFMDETADDVSEVGEIYEVTVWNPKRQRFDEESEDLRGSQRLKLHVGVDPGVERAALRYYFEQFGEVRFPS